MPPDQFYGELFEVRQMIEPQAAALAARRATAAEIAGIADAFNAMTEASPQDASAAEADLLFHRSILAAGHNALLLQLYIAHKISSESFTVFLPMHKLVLGSGAEMPPRPVMPWSGCFPKPSSS